MLATLFLISVLPSCIICQTRDQILNNPNDFFMFENFEVTRSLHVQEASLVNQLKDVRDHLLHRQRVIKDMLENKDVKKVGDLQERQNVIKIAKSLIDGLPSDVFPSDKDFTGAIRGMVRLQFAYQMNLTALSEEGKIQFQSSAGYDGQSEGFDSYERLPSIDFALIAEEAFGTKNYATSIDFARESLRLETTKKEIKARQMTKEHLKRLKKLVKELVNFNNGYLTKRQRAHDRDFLVKPYLVDDKLRRKKDKHQPKFVKKGELMVNYKEDLTREHLFMQLCREGGIYNPDVIYNPLNCRYLHHGDPFLKLGPFKEEQKSRRPYAVIFVDILNEKEMEFLITETRPKLSTKRFALKGADVTDAIAPHEFKSGNKVKVVHKTVQAWLPEANYTDGFQVLLPPLWKLAKKIQLATQMKTRGKYASTAAQVTNYGLGGLCEIHIDPHGYIEGKELNRDRQGLIDTGDIFGTFMAWLDDVEAGGGTAFLQPGWDLVVEPERGSAAFWYDLDAKGHRELASQHGGCPVLKGSKWILNKWVHFFDNFAKFPCHLDSEALVSAPDSSHYF